MRTIIHLIKTIKRAVGGGNDALESFVRRNRLTKPIDPSQTVFLGAEDRGSLKSFADLCHDRVRDRDHTFTIEKRLRLYERWLSSGQPCLMAVTDGGQEIVGASIVLPLNDGGYDRFCFHGLDALDLERHHFVTPDPSGESFRYLLIDMLATNRDLIKTLPRSQRDDLTGIGFRAMLYHVARFLDPGRHAPILICSSQNRPLVRLLTALQFDDQCQQAGKTPIYRADLSRLDFYPRPIRKYYRLIFSLARHYRGD